jgi:hypothetical protein
MKDHTTILIGGDDLHMVKGYGTEKIMYVDYPNFEDMPQAAKSDDTRKEHEEFWAGKMGIKFENFKKGEKL